MDRKVYGHVKWFDAQRGYGFVTSDSGQHVFLHYSDLIMDGYKSVEPGQTVAFYITRNEKGLNASAVEILEAQ